MSVLRAWYDVQEVRAVEDKIEVDCIGMCMSIDMQRGVEYEVYCAFRDIDKHYRLVYKLSKIAVRHGIRGSFTVSSYDSKGNVINHNIST